MNDGDVRLDALDRERAQRLAAGGAVVLLPIGATEQHGPHLPLATDTMHVEHVALEAARALAGRIAVCVAPPLPYGCSEHHLRFGGTASLTPATLLAVLDDLCRSLAASGFRRIFLVNGHGGNHHLVAQAANDAANRHGVDAAAASWWHLAAPALAGADALADGNVPGHAGAFETSLVLALRPDLVAGRRPGDDRAAATGSTFGGPLTLALKDTWRANDGWSDRPDRADGARGRRYLELGAQALAAAVTDLVRASEGELPT